MIDRKPIFTAVRALRKGQAFTLAEVKLLDAAIDDAVREIATPVPINRDTVPIRPGRQVNQRGIDLIKSFEGCAKILPDGRIAAYPDPGTGGDPWTIGFGSTGPDIKRGTIWTRAQADQRFAEHIAHFAAGVDRLLGDTPTTSNAFSAMVSLAYNIGLGAFQKSSVLRHHKSGDHKEAARSFLMWNKAGGKAMRGLTRRRVAESDLYDDPEVQP